jgi:two-component system, LytTR family, response regulator
MMDCIIIDDSKMARMAIKMLISQVDFLNLKKECEDPVEGFNYLKAEPVDLVFLDVEMPGMSGIELLKNLSKPPIVILVTSKKDYAVEAFELNVADYLIKPVTLPRFLTAVDRAKELFDNRGDKVEFDDKNNGYIFVRANSVLNRVKLSDILYIQALGDYVNIYVPGKRYMVHSTLKSMEERLPPDKFFRLHRSYLIGVDHIDVIEEGTAYVEKNAIPIGEQYKKELLKKLNLL